MSFDSRALRDTFGMFGTGVCVITAQAPGVAPFGLTVNSFAAVSLEPPLLLWSLQKNSEMLPAFEQTDRWAVNVLGADQQADSNRYAKKGDHSLEEGSYRIGASGAPVMNECIAQFECVDWQRVDGGDHIIFIGQVEQVARNAEGQPLLFFSGKYREVK